VIWFRTNREVQIVTSVYGVNKI